MVIEFVMEFDFRLLKFFGFDWGLVVVLDFWLDWSLCGFVGESNDIKLFDDDLLLLFLELCDCFFCFLGIKKICKI